MKVTRPTRWGFTLIEVLVVVSIIALLISIMLPSLCEARAQARSLTCKSSLHQLGIGMTMYLHQYKAFPAHQWRLGDPDDTRVRWFNAMAKLLKGYEVTSCPEVPEWDIGRNNSYGYNYKYLGSVRDNAIGPRSPYENFPVKSVHSPSMTIAFGDTDGTGWKNPHVNGVKDVDMLGNHGYTLDPTFIPDYSLESYSGGELEPYAWHSYRTYISTRHRDASNLCFVDAHVERMEPRQVYKDNRYWNGHGGEDPERDPHIPDKYLDGEWRFPDMP